MISPDEKTPSKAVKKAINSTALVTRQILDRSKEKMQETGDKVKEGVEDVKAVAKSITAEDIATTLALLFLV